MTDETFKRFRSELNSFFILIILNLVFGALAMAFGVQFIVTSGTQHSGRGRSYTVPGRCRDFVPDQLRAWPLLGCFQCTDPGGHNQNPLGIPGFKGAGIR